ncbi:MAG: hypothetical protein H6539_00005, partial [Bacteroidales bacterium]|nr:hypothetical protein [Bacteroidales bacterium]
KSLPVGIHDDGEVGKENFTTEVKKTIPPDKENFTTEVKKTLKKPLVTIDIEEVTDALILNNTTRVLPVPAKSGSTGQSHSNGNTKGNIGDELDLECVELQSLASPSVLAPSLHTPKVEVEKGGDKSSLPIGDNKSEPLPMNTETIPNTDEQIQLSVKSQQIPIEPDKRFAEQLETYTTSIYFLPDNLSKVKDLYKAYSKQYPNDYLPIMVFEMALVYLMNITIGGSVDRNGINYSLMYKNEICYNFKLIPNVIQEMMENPDDTGKLLKKYKLKKQPLSNS